MPTISVIIPIFNGENTIQETIESVINQTFPDFELIVINDGSTDATLDILSTIKDPRLKVFSYPNAGQGESRNRGFVRSSGEYIAFLDADDLWTPDKLETQLKALEAYPDAAVAYSWTNSIDESGHLISPGPRPHFEGDVFQPLLLSNFLVNGSNPLIRSQALLELGGFNPSLPPAEDWDMWLRLSNCYHFVVVKSPQILYRQSTESASANVLKMESASLKLLKPALTFRTQESASLKNKVLGNLYTYLTWKALAGIPNKKNCLIAFRFLGYGFRYHPSLLFKKAMIKVLLRIIILLLLPPQLAASCISRFKSMTDHTTILGYIQTEIH